MPGRGVGKAKQKNRDVSEGQCQEKDQRAGHWTLPLEERSCSGSWERNHRVENGESVYSQLFREVLL